MNFPFWRRTNAEKAKDNLRLIDRVCRMRIALAIRINASKLTTQELALLLLADIATTARTVNQPQHINVVKVNSCAIYEESAAEGMTRLDDVAPATWAWRDV